MMFGVVLFSVLTVLPSYSLARNTRLDNYSWKTGAWGVCWSDTGCGRGIEERTVWCADHLNRTVPTDLCTRPDKPPVTRNCYTTCQDIEWVVHPWSNCSTDPTTRSPEGICQGVKHRTLSCNTSLRPCIGLKPAEEANCTAECPQDCKVGQWSKWTKCTSCGELQSRNRAVTLTPTIGGKQCPRLTMVRICDENCTERTTTEKRETPFVRIGEWSECDVDHREEEELEEEEEVEEMEEEEEFSGDGSEVSRRIRKREVTKMEKADTEKKSVDEIARIGSQTRKISCLNDLNEELPMSDCLSYLDGPLPSSERPCIVPRDCHVTSWTPWVTIIPGCVAPSGVVVREVRSRHRSAKLLHQGDGVPCPHLVERHTLPRPKLIPCDAKYEWIPSSWGSCVSTVGPDGVVPVTCGGGVQKRKVFCARAHDKVPVEDKLCTHTQPPPVYQRCEVGCERDCQMGPWSAWGTCTPTDCSFIPPPAAPGFRRRRRELLISPSYRGKECGPMEEQSDCHGAQCHQWVIGEWGSCTLKSGPRRCGPGTSRRNLSCLDAFGRPSPNEECEAELGEMSLTKDCHVPCPFDCIVNPWSEWSPCSRPCSSDEQVGYTKRNTTIVAPPSKGSKECPPPDELLEVSTCRLEPCGGAKWLPGAWSDCSPDGDGDCGSGTQTRSLRCIGSDNSSLPLKSCRGLQQPSQERNCEVECGMSCSLSPWSEWTPCSAPTPCDHRGMISSVQKRYREILIAPWGIGSSCGPLHEERSCAVAPKFCPGTHWKTEAWSRCHLSAGQRCGPGIRVRKITCVDHINNILEPTSCLIENTVVPEGSEECQVSCDNHCTISKWSDWSPCPEQVPCSQATGIRKRWLIDGSQMNPICQNMTLENKSPCPCHSHFSSPVSNWSVCVVGGHAMQGKVNFVFGTSYSTATEDKDDSTSSEYFESSGTGFIRSDGSYSIDGVFDSYYLTGTDKPDSGKSVDSKTWNREKKMEQDIREELNDEIRFMDLTVEDGSRDVKDESEVQVKGICGVGARYRSVTCVRDDDVIVHPRACGHSGLEWEPCMVECPVDCKVDKWGPWSECNSSCGPGLQTRRRKIVSAPLWGGRLCPEVFQSRSCWGTCEGVWAAAGWSDCLGSDGTTLTNCGNGTQMRTVRCEKETSDGLRSEVSPQECLGLSRPKTIRSCEVACPGECVVSPWGEWSTCEAGCPIHSTRTRRREILRQPSPASSRDCPNLYEEEPCLAGFSCWWYSWQVGNWTSCVPLGQSSCGEGVMNRPVACVRSDGIKVDERLCGEESKPTPRETWCYVDCPIDCEVTPWIDWDSTHCSCGDNPGNMTRIRYISVNPSESGRSCPTVMRQQRPCPAIPCYTWERGPWGHCQLQGAKCGHGTIEREVSCVGSGGEKVDPSLCLALFHVGGHTWPFLAHALDLNTKDSCFVSCEGGCELTEWSVWSHCHRNCGEGEHGGVQARTRGILSEGLTGKCGQDLKQSRPCLASPCQTFSWQLRDGQARCVRSDGVVVAEGCEERSRPCYPGCNVPQSRCSELGWCTCKPGYKGQYSEGQRYTLTRCVRDTNSSRYSIPMAQKMVQQTLVPEKINIWMFAMIGIGGAFMIFVALSMYLLCQESPSDDSSPYLENSRSSSNDAPPVEVQKFSNGKMEAHESSLSYTQRHSCSTQSSALEEGLDRS